MLPPLPETKPRDRPRPLLTQKPDRPTTKNLPARIHPYAKQKEETRVKTTGMTFSCGLEGIYLYQPPALRVPRCTSHAVVSQSLHLFHTRARLPVSHGEALTIHLLLSDGQDRVLSLPPATTPQTLRHHLLAQGLVASHQADGKPIALLLLDLSLPSLGLRCPVGGSGTFSKGCTFVKGN